MTRRIRVRLTLATVLPALFVLVAVLAGSVPVAHAATITVDSTAGDVTAADGNCTLREAINNAESDSDTTGGDCPAGSGADTIDLGISLTYTLDEIDNNNNGANGLPLITTDITINGNGSTVERSGVVETPQFRIFRVASSGVLVLNALTVRNGDAGNSSGGAIRTDGSVTIINNSTITQNNATGGGGIQNNGTLTVDASSIEGNTSARNGGGIRNSGSGTLTMNASDVSNNAAGDAGGGISGSGTLTLDGTNVSNNTAARWGGGIFHWGLDVSSITDSPISANAAGRSGGGINNGGTLTITNTDDTRISGNTAGESGGGINNSGTLTLANIITSGNTADTFGGGIYNSSDGTLTLTGSPVGGNTAGFDGGGINNDGTLTLTDSTIINNTAGGRGGGINQWSNGVAVLTTTNNSTISNNTASFEGGGIANDGMLTMTEIPINGNTAGFDGGGIHNGGSGVADLTNSTISANTADFDGGGVRNSGTLTLTESTVGTNTAGNIGGGIRSTGSGTLTVFNSTISGNTSTNVGGGIRTDAVLTLTNSTISGNSSIEGHGGGIDNHATSTLTNVTVSVNSSLSGGGGIHNTSGTISLANTIVANNLSGGDCNGIITSLGNNLDSDNTCGLAGPGDITGQLEQKISDTRGGFTGVLDDFDRFGRAVASLGDLDGDVVSDLAVSAYFDDDGGTDRGSVWILFMNANGRVKSHQKISDTEGGFTGVLDDFDYFGGSTASMGDLDGDGVSDLAVASYHDDDGGTDRGAVWILFMNANGTVKAHQKISDTEGGFTGVLDDGDQFGFGVASLGDLDGDAVSDLAVGARRDDDGGTNRGAVWILFLNADGTVKAQQKISATAGGFTGNIGNEDLFGLSTASLGDLDGDGVADLAVGAGNDDDGGTNRGAVWILFLNADGTVKAQQKISDTQGGFTGVLNDSDFFGIGAGLGDVDGDDVSDLAVGAQRDNDGGSDRGAVWVLFLNADGTVESEQKISDTAGGFTGALDDSDLFGIQLANLGDLDGDGVADMAVGAANDDDGGTDRGAVWVLFLNADGTVKTLDPLLGPLQDNGGPTFTHALQSGSPAIDTGNNVPCPLTDQRGVPRPRDGDDNGNAICDIGAYEFGFKLTGPTPGQAGVVNTIEVSGAPPSREISFVFGFNAAPPAGVPGCPGTMVDIDQFEVVATATSDASGDASLTGNAPASFAGQTIRLQAVELVSCQVSNVVVHMFP